MESGTTSLYAWLARHPDVFPAVRKELHFFDVRWARGVGRYWVDFPMRPQLALARAARRRAVVTGEATPSYLFHPEVPERMHLHLPDAKIVVLLRDPVARAVSHYWDSVRSGLESLSLADALEAEPTRMAAELARIDRGEDPSPMWRIGSYVTRGLYAEQLRRWLTWYPRDQLLLLRFDERQSDPAAVCARTLDFIGVDPAHMPRVDWQPENVSAAHPDAPPETVDWLRSRFVAPNETLARELDVTF